MTDLERAKIKHSDAVVALGQAQYMLQVAEKELANELKKAQTEKVEE